MQNGLATAGTNFTEPGAHNKGDLCRRVLVSSDYDADFSRANGLLFSHLLSPFHESLKFLKICLKVDWDMF